MTATFGFRVTARDGRARLGRDDDAARRRADAGVHARRDPGRRQGDAAARPARGRGGDHPGEHVSPVPPARRRTDRAARRPASVHRLGPADPDRQRRLPGLLARRTRGRSTSAASPSSRTSTAARTCSRPRRPPTSRPISARTSRWCSTSASAIRPPGTRRRPRWSGRSAGRPAAAGGSRSCRRKARGGRRKAGSGGGAEGRGPRAESRLRSNPGQAQFGIVQGGTHPDLRVASAQATVELGFEAYAIGGLSVGEPPDLMYETVGETTPLLPDDRPRYLMGTGTPVDLVEAVALGVDLFDCVLPTRNARNGQLFTSDGPPEHQERPVRRTTPAGRPAVRVLHLPALLEGLSSPSVRGRGDHRSDPQHTAQPDVLP